ncbi:hypothetical protein [Sinomicrobium sp.]
MNTTFHHYVWKQCPITSSLARKEKSAAYQTLRTNQSKHSEDPKAMFFSDTYLKSMGTDRKAFERMRKKTGMFDRVGEYSKSKGICYPLAHNYVSRDVVVGYVTDTPIDDLLAYEYEGAGINFDAVKHLMATSNDTRLIAESAKFFIGAQENKLLDISYEQPDCGRKFAKGSYTIQRLPSEIRNAALQGWYDYDIQNCHVALLNNFGNFPAMKYYQQNTQAVREELSIYCGITVSDVKITLLSLLYGSKLNKYSSIYKRIGDKMYAFANHPFVKDFISDCKDAEPLLLEKANELGLHGDKKSSICAKVLMSYESKILDILTEDVLDSVLMFDGYMTKFQCDVEEKKRIVSSRLGLDISITEELL